MANPTTVSCTKKTWTKVVDNKQVGSIYLQSTFFKKAKAYFVFLDTGETAPTLSPGESGSTAVAMESEYLPFNSNVAIDIYLWPPGRDTIAVISVE